MKLKSLILGSVAAAGLSTAGFAADLGVLTSLDVCDALGLSGLTISSDTNCLQISGGVSYEFRWGDYRTGLGTGNRQVLGSTPLINSSPGGFRDAGNIDTIGSSDDWFGGLVGDSDQDWESKIEAWVKFVGTADSDFGPASATIKLRQLEKTRYTNEGDGTLVPDPDNGGVLTPIGGISHPDDTNGLIIDEAYVSIGDQTVIMAGKKSSIANFGDSDAFNFLGTFGTTTETDTGVLFQNDEDENFTGGQVIQVVSDLGNGISVGASLENLAGPDLVANDDKNKIDDAGTLIGVVSYAGENLTAHLTGLAIGVLDGEVERWGVHAGATGTFDLFKVRGAVGYYGEDIGGIETNVLHAMATAEAAFDMFKVALSGEYIRNEEDGIVDDGFGLGGSIGATVTDGVSINLGARYFSADFDPLSPSGEIDNDTLQVAAQLVAAITETIKVTGEIGGYFNEDYEVFSDADDGAIYYGSVGLAWAPGGGFTSSVIGEANSEGAYRATFRAAKTFE
jgi:hypothetical protein